MIGGLLEKERQKTSKAICARKQQQKQLQRVRAEMAQKAKSDDALAQENERLIQKEKALVEKKQTLSEMESFITKKARKISVKENAMATRERAMTEKVQSMQRALAELEEQRGAALAYGVALFSFICCALILRETLHALAISVGIIPGIQRNYGEDRRH